MLEVVTAAESTDLTTIVAVQTEIGTLTDPQKVWAMSAIEAASALIEQEANQIFAQQNYTETIAGSGSSHLMLDRTPIIGTPTIVSTDNEVIVDFVVDDALAGILYRRQGWTQEISYQRGITYDPLGYETHPSFVITYVAGYHLPSFPDAIDTDSGEVELPAHIERACILTVKAWWHSKNRDSTVSWKQVGDLALGFRGEPAVKGQEPLRLPPEARALIKPRIF
jgi:hypothetical protein